MSAACSLPSRAGGLALAALALIAAAALPVWALGAGPAARELLAFGFDGPAREPDAALAVAATNLRLVAAALIAAWAVRTRPRLRLAFDLTLALLLVLNTAAAGVAFGAYGARLLGAVALHGPLELAAFALAGGAYLAARGGEPSRGQLAAVSAMASGLVAAGAAVETYVRLGGAS